MMFSQLLTIPKILPFWIKGLRYLHIWEGGNSRLHSIYFTILIPWVVHLHVLLSIPIMTILLSCTVFIDQACFLILSERKPWGPQLLRWNPWNSVKVVPEWHARFPRAPSEKNFRFWRDKPNLCHNKYCRPSYCPSHPFSYSIWRRWLLFGTNSRSDAKVIITEPKPGAAGTGIIIPGTPEQTHGAESLIQVFVMSEKECT